MKSKKSIYVLLPLVLFIWGTIIYKLFSYTNESVYVVQDQEVYIKPLQIKQKDTFTIKMNSRDPFTGELVDESTYKSRHKVNNTSPKEKEELIWPVIKYKGIVSDVKDKVKIYMLIIEGRTFLMRKGQKENNILLKDGDKDMVYLKYKDDSKVVFIQ